MSKRIACLGDGASHPGSLISTNQDGKFKVAGLEVCVEGCFFQCEEPEHGTTSVSAIVTKSQYGGKLIVTEGATAGCGAVIEPPDRKVYVE